MSNNNEGKCLHIAMYPWFAFGHLTSFLQLANRLAQRGHKVSFFLPTKTQSKLAAHNHYPNLITFIPITVPPVHGLPLGAETTNDVSSSLHPFIMVAMDLTLPIIDSHLALLRPDYIFFDYTEWLPRLARKYSVKSLYYSVSYMVNMAYCMTQARNLPRTHYIMEADLASPPPGFPCPSIRLQAQEARHLAYACEMEFGGMKLKERHAICFEECDVIGIKTCREMEGGYYSFVNKYWNKPLLLVGPRVPELPTSSLDNYFDGWLKGFGQGSVVYCALGSECVLHVNQFQELVLGLEVSGLPFLAALRTPRGFEKVEQALPEGFIERIKGRGIIHDGWVQQPLILHHPSVGCFVTHCGAGSLSEGMLTECQLVFMPQAADQFINARMMSLDLKVGVEVLKGEDDGFFSKEAVFKAIDMVMEPDSSVGREVRANHTKWRNLISSEGFEESYISEFVQSLQDLL